MKTPTIFIENKKARLRFSVIDTYQAGLELTGTEVKSLRDKRGKIDGARVIIRGGEAYLVGMSVPAFQPINTASTYEPERTRRLLLKKKEIGELAEAESRKGLTIVPLEVYNAGRYIKVRVAIVRGKGKEDKREDLKKKDAERDSARELRRK